MRIALVVPSRSDPAHGRVLDALRKRLSLRGEEVYEFPPKKSPSPQDPRGGLERLLRGQGIEVCHVHWFSRGLGYLSRLRFPPGLKLILTHQGASLRLMERRDAFLRLAQRADALTSVSRQGLEEMLDFLPRAGSKSRYIPNGADFSPPPGRLPSSAPRPPFILSVGRLAAYKGTDLLLMAFAGLACEDRGLDLVICGPDQAGTRLSRFAARLGLKGRVHFLGDTKPPLIRSLLRGCLFFALPSRQENMPMALLEAMAEGKAVIASAVGGINEVVEDGVNGLLVASKDVPALTAAMRRLAHDAPLRVRLGRQALKRARLFDWSVVAAQYRRLYASLLAADRLPGNLAKKSQVAG